MDDGGSDLELDITEDGLAGPPSVNREENNKRCGGGGIPSPNSKRSRRSVQKRVVSIPMTELEGSRAKGGGGSEGAPPSDSWAWRKYGQKPIKGSPYPRGYYRCSSSKGCPARKQVERSRLDPTMIVVTYSFDHNHSWPLPKNSSKNNSPPPPPTPLAPPPTPPSEEPAAPPPEEAAAGGPGSPEEKFLDLIGGDGGDFDWITAEGCSPSSASPSGCDEMLYGSVFFGGPAAASAEGLPEIAAGGGEEEDSLFAGLGELPECSVVFRRRLTSAPWVGST